MTGRYKPLLWFAYLSGCLWAALTMIYTWYGYEGPWIDRFIAFEISLTALFTVVAMAWKTEQWTRRGLGIWGFMGAIVLLYIASQVREWGLVTGPLPPIVINTWRAPLFLGGLFMLYGYYKWAQDDSWDGDADV